MAQMYNAAYVLPGPTTQPQHCSPQLGLIVQCPYCASRFNFSPRFIYPQRWPQNVTYSQGSNFQYIQPFIQYLSPQTGAPPTFYPPIPPAFYIFGVNQQHQEIADNTNSRQYASQYALNVNDMIVHRIRDILIDILTSSMCAYGVSVSQLMVLLKQSCENDKIILPSSVMHGFKDFLRNEMTDYVEVKDDLCRYRHPTLPIQEESISSSVCERTSGSPKTSPAALVSWQVGVKETYSAENVKKVVSKEQEMKENIALSLSLTEFHSNKSKEFYGGIEHRGNGDAIANPIISSEDRKYNVLHEHVEANAISECSYTRNNLTKIMEEWKKIFVGDLKELIRYLRMVDDYFQESDSKFTLSGFKEVFGELNKRWEFCDIDLVEMGIINMVHGTGWNEEPVLIVNPIVREMEFPEVAELAREIYNFLSKLLLSVNSVKVEVIVRTVNFGINNKKTIDEKYALLWEVFSDSHFQHVFIVDVLQKQNKERGFDVMIRLNMNLNLLRIFNE
ncbi:hypothetical protein WUBG_01863 [Wuchereria bancrofti]|uniref:Uncharacterized protein n=2 Tax=Wuchereria bancrofti TaxID=6293 RepID=J9EX92_WUCBA|nr:hypothetical protein WUBG_01863 [Wuchereria bancrofti]VDM08045.1 unnamed protein product [Wuchereria bancrofti]